MLKQTNKALLQRIEALEQKRNNKGFDYGDCITIETMTDGTVVKCVCPHKDCPPEPCNQQHPDCINKRSPRERWAYAVKYICG